MILVRQDNNFYQVHEDCIHTYNKLKLHNLLHDKSRKNISNIIVKNILTYKYGKIICLYINVNY